MTRRGSTGLLMPTNVIDMVLPLSFVVKNHVSPNACGTQMTGRFTTLDMMQEEAANHYYQHMCANTVGPDCTPVAVSSSGIGWLLFPFV